MKTLNDIIEPEIINNELFDQIRHIVYECNMTTIIEIGSSNGKGSTQAIVDGIKATGLEEQSKVFCIEVSKARYNDLIKNHKSNPFIIPYNYCSVHLKDYMPEILVKHFYESVKTNLNNYSLETVLQWREEEINYIKEKRIPFNGIDSIMIHNDINKFDLAILDGSAFTGNADCLKLIYCADWIILDDINGIKNYYSDNILDGDKASYELVVRNFNLRNGYSVFKRKGI